MGGISRGGLLNDRCVAKLSDTPAPETGAALSGGEPPASLQTLLTRASRLERRLGRDAPPHKSYFDSAPAARPSTLFNSSNVLEVPGAAIILRQVLIRSILRLSVPTSHSPKLGLSGLNRLLAGCISIVSVTSRPCMNFRSGGARQNTRGYATVDGAAQRAVCIAAPCCACCAAWPPSQGATPTLPISFFPPLRPKFKPPDGRHRRRRPSAARGGHRV